MGPPEPFSGDLLEKGVARLRASMAKMFPEVFPGTIDQGNPEFVVYQALRSLPDDYVVFYSKRIMGNAFSKAETEIDFLISNQKDIVICLEVKGGLISYDGVRDSWSQNGKPMEKSPDRQATAAAHSLIRALSHELKNVNTGWALCFPQCTLSSPFGATGLPISRIFDENRLLRITDELHAFEYELRATFGKKGMTPFECQKFISHLTRSIGFVQILGVRIAREANQLLQVTQEQCEVLADLEVNPRMVVHGSAGTGKSILAQEFSKRLAMNGLSVLLLFYNKGIASKVRRAFEKESGVSVATFLSFAKRLVEENDPAWWDNQNKKDDDFWHLTLPAKLLDIPKDKTPTYDAIIIDEGQDFKPEWLEYLQTLLKPGGNTRFCVFLDEHQDIFGHWKSFPSRIPPARKVLTKNCRNTKSIVSFISDAYPTPMVSFEKSPDGTPVVIRTSRNDTEEQTQLVRDIKHLVNGENVLPGSIVILLNSTKDESSLSNTKSIAGFALESTYGRYDPKSRCVYYSTIEIFKGLESDVVMLLLGNDLEDSEIPNIFYVQGSRAKHALYIYRRDALKDAC